MTPRARFLLVLAAVAATVAVILALALSPRAPFPADPTGQVAPPVEAPEDEVAWSEVEAAGWAEAYEWFLRTFPDSRHASEARERLADAPRLPATAAPAPDDDDAGSGDIAAGGADDGDPGAWPDGETAGSSGSGDDGGATGTGSDDADPEAALREQLRAADLAFNRPDRMEYRQATVVELVLSPATANARAEGVLSPGLSGEVRVVEGVEYALRTRATLAGADFSVTPAGPQERTVLADRPTRWVWTVVPTAWGEGLILTLAVEAVIARDGEDLPPVAIETFSETIPVDVGLWDWMVGRANEVKAVHAAAAALAGTLVVAGGWLFRRRRGGSGPGD